MPLSWSPSPSGSAASRAAPWLTISRSDRVPTQPAISSIASGRQSSRRHSSAMTRGATSLPAKPGSRSSALAMNSCTASDDAISATGAAEEGQAIGGTGQHSSPGTPRTVRLVTTTRSPGTAISRRLTSAATSSRRCSAPSITTRRPVAASAASTDAMTSTPGWSRSRRQAATAEVSDSGWRTGSSGMTTVWPGSAKRRMASKVSRVLPTPGGPVTLISRDCPCSSRNSSASSASRPTKLECGTGSGPGGGLPALTWASNSARARSARADIRVRPASQRLTVANETPRRRASCSWLRSRLARSRRRRCAAEPASASGASPSTVPE